MKEQNLPSLSSDAIRGLLTGDETDQTVNRIVFGTLRKLLTRRIASGAPVTVIDTTALTNRERRSWIRLAELYDCDIEAVYFDTPLDECLRRNAARERIVPPDVIERMNARMTPPTVEEGFSRVTTIAVPKAIAQPESAPGSPSPA